jgi:iron complex outermembrane receptor protein
MLQTGATIGKPVVNGMHSNRLLILNNGIRQEGQQWGAEHAPEIDPFIAQNISVVKGSEAIRYGAEAIGGVVIIEPPALPSDSTIHAEVNLVGASNGRSGTVSGMLSGNFKKIPALAWRIQGTAKRSGNLQTADYFLDNTGSKELNYSAALGYNKEHMGFDLFFSHFNTELGIFKESHIGSTEDLYSHIEHGRPFDNGSFYYAIDAPKQQVVHNLFKATGHIHLNDHHLTLLCTRIRLMQPLNTLMVNNGKQLLVSMVCCSKIDMMLQVLHYSLYHITTLKELVYMQ